MSSDQIMALERQIFDLKEQLYALRRAQPGEEVANYRFQTLEGETSLYDLFGEHDRLLMIHNMGQACRYCTLWADGFNGLLPHLESAMSVVLVSKDAPETQRRFARSRNWGFRMASHGGGRYISEQTVLDGDDNMPGAVVYERDGDKVLRKNAAVFGPGDIYCSQYSVLGLAGLEAGDWTPQFRYWQRPRQMDDGGENVLD